VALRTAIRSPEELCRILDLPQTLAEQSLAATSGFPLFATKSYIERIRPGDPLDPLLRQVLPLAAETNTIAEFTADPVGDLQAEHSRGLLQKYSGRALLIVTGACAIHCRYCFRRHFPYDTLPHTLADWEPALAEISRDTTLSEVILSGGDPLMLRDPLLHALAERLAQVPHLRRLRVHTRLPIMIPERVNSELLAWLAGTRLAPVLVIHANHAAELSGAAATAIRSLVQAGVPTLNQAVLLRGVNDSVFALVELSERLIDLGVMPYYLHQLDRVAGAAHFEVPVSQGLELLAELRKVLPGYAVPRYVREEPGALHKLELAAENA
jgi:EF-P beta-lysylation protein EpmB